MTRRVFMFRFMVLTAVLLLLSAGNISAHQIELVSQLPSLSGNLQLKISGSTAASGGYLTSLAYSIELARGDVPGHIKVEATTNRSGFAVPGSYEQSIFLSYVSPGTYFVEYYVFGALVDSIQFTVEPAVYVPIDIRNGTVNIDAEGQVTFHNIAVPRFGTTYSATFVWNPLTLGWDIISAEEE